MFNPSGNKNTIMVLSRRKTVSIMAKKIFDVLNDCYVSPTIRAIEIEMTDILCYSGNEDMEEIDLGNGGFGQY